MYFQGTSHELKCYLKYLKRTRGIRVRRIETIGANTYHLDTGGEGMKEIPKNTQEKIRIEKREYKGKEFIDIRIYYASGEEWKPSPKGVTFNPAMIPDIMKALESLQE